MTSATNTGFIACAEPVAIPVRRASTVEIYQTTQVNVRYRLNHTDLCLPVVACS